MSYKLYRRGHKWCVRYYVPKDLQPLYGSPEVCRSLKTADWREANQLAPSVVARIQADLGAIKLSDVRLPASDPRSLTNEAQRLRALVEAGHLQPEGDPEGGTLGASDLFDLAVDEHFDTYRERDPDTGYPQLSPEVRAIIRDGSRLASDPDYRPLKDWIDHYLQAKAGTISVGAENAKRRLLGELAKWLGNLRDPRTITRKELIKYVETELPKPRRNGKKREPKTIKDDISNIRAFFGWLMDREVISANPSERLMRLVHEDRRGKAPRRRPWGEAELLTLLTDDRLDPRPQAAACIALYSGMRLEEVCSLTVDAVEPDRLKTMAGKSAAAVRPVPIHPILKPLIDQLRETSRDGFLIPKLLRGGMDDKRGHYLGKRFGEWRKLALPGVAGITYHSLRNTFMTACENAGAPKDSVKLIVGHSRTDITYGLYSTGPEFQKLAGWVRKLTYGGQVDDRARMLSNTLAARLAAVPPPSHRGRKKKQPRELV